MNRWLLVIGAMLSLAVTGCASLGVTEALHPPAIDTAAAPALPADRQLLVMLAEQFVPHYRPDAGGGGSYGAAASGQQMRTARALAKAYGFTVLADWPMPALGVRCFVAEVTAGQTPADVIERLSADPRVESAQALQSFRVLGRDTSDITVVRRLEDPAIPGLSDQHHDATGKGVTVAQIDTGVDVRHPALRGQIVETRNFADGTPFGPEFHGTAVAGIIVAKTHSDLGGIAPGASLISLRACWPDPRLDGAAVCDTFTLAKALQYALTRNVRIINLSLGGPRDRLLERLLDQALERGITILGAVDPGATGETFPAHHPGVVAVATEWSPRVPAGTVFVPGTDVLTTIPNGRWGLVSGTSFATAHVTGVTALLLECSPRLERKEVAILLRLTLQQRGPTHAAGAVPDLCAALGRVAVHASCTCCCAKANPVGGNAFARHAS